MSEYIISEDLAVWFGKKKKPKGSKQPKGPWVNICRKDKDGKHPPCGRSNADKGAYPKCRAAGVAGKMSAEEKKSACRQKRRAEKKDTQTGKGQKPVMTSHKKKTKKESVDTKLIQNVLKEYIEVKQNISEEMKYHIDNQIPVSENVFRVGTKKYFDIISEARTLKEMGLYGNDKDNEILESDLGKFFTYNGVRLPLEYPLVKEDADKEMVDGIIDILNQVKDIENRKSIAKNMISQFEREDVEYDHDKFMESIGLLNEAEYQGKKVELGKPKSGGSKKWYVYVRDPKTKKIKKVSYGSPVMTAKWNDPDARASFAARHQCDKKKDKTKAGYWACRAHKDFGKNVPGRFW
jgi:hypothetical protein